MKLVDPMLHPLLRHPRTGQPLRAIGLSPEGLPLWPLMGGDGEEGGDDGGEDADEDADEEEETEDENGSEDKSVKGKKKSGPVSREEFDRLRNQLSNADRRRVEAERKAAELQKEKDAKEREGKPELDNLKKDHEDLTKAHEKLQTGFRKLAMENAFHTASAQAKIAWHNPKVALRSADLDDLEVDEKGEVDGILEAVKALAKSNPFLVNTGNKDNEEGDDKEKKPPRRGASGNGIGSGKVNGKGTKGGLSEEELRRRFPALNRHR